MNNTILDPFFASESLKRTIRKIGWLIGLYLGANLIYFLWGNIDPDIYSVEPFKKGYILFTAIAVFCFYFIVNRNWTGTLMVLAALLLYIVFRKNIAAGADYYLSFVMRSNTSTIVSITGFLLLLLVNGVATACYCRQEGIKTRKQRLLVLLLVFCLFYGFMDMDLGLAESMDFSETWKKITADIVRACLYTMKDLSLLVGFLHLLSRVKQGASLFRLPEPCTVGRRVYARSFFVGYNVFFFILIGFSIKLVLFGFSVFGSFSLSKFLDATTASFIFLLSALFLGDIIKRRAQELENYYGAAGFAAWIPLVNLVSYLVILFAEKPRWIKLKTDRDFARQRKVHLAICFVLIIGIQYLIYKGSENYMMMALFSVFYCTATVILALFKRIIAKLSVIAALLYFLAAVFSIGDLGVVTFTWEYFKDYISISALLFLFYLSMVHYGVFHIVQQSLYADEVLDIAVPVASDSTISPDRSGSVPS